MLLNAFVFPSIYFLLHASFGLDCEPTTTSNTISTIFSNTNIETLFPSWWNSSCNICDWNTTYITCSSTSDIIAIQMESIQLTGFLTLDATTPWPSSIKLINLNHNSLTGSIPWSYLPQSIQFLYLGDNAFTGSIDFNALNQYTNLTALYLSHNKLTSSLSWHEYNTVTPSLQYLFLTNNELFGNIDFNTMPFTLKYCLLGHNQFNGSLDFTTNNESILDVIEYLDISHNKLSGTITNLENMGQNIEYLRMNNNHLYAEINEILNVLSSTDIMDLSVSHNNITGSINWDIFNNDTSSFAFLEALYIHSNQISGDIIASLLPSNLEKFYFYNNKFDTLSGLSSLPNSVQFLIGDNNAFTGELDLSFINNNIEYIWLYNNLFNSTTIDMDEFNSTSLKQLILSNNRFKNRINLQSIDTYLPNVQRLYLDNNLFENTDDLDFSDISVHLSLKLDQYLSCDGSIYCDNTDYNCSISRKNNTCRGPLQCENTCECQFSANCSLYIDDQEDPETYFNGNYSVNYHDIMRDIDMKYGDDNMDDLWLLQTINIDDIIPIIEIDITSTMFEISTSTMVTSTFEVIVGDDSEETDKNALAEAFGSEAVAWVVFVIIFLVIVGSIYVAVWYMKRIQIKQIVHNIQIEEVNPDSTLKEDDGTKSPSGLATKYLTLEPVLKIEDVKLGDHEFMKAASVSDGSDIGNVDFGNVDFGNGDFGDGNMDIGNNAVEQQQLMMQMMMVNNMMMAQMQQNMDPQLMNNMMMTNNINMDPQQQSMANTLNMQQQQQQLAMTQMTQQANVIPAGQVQSMNSMQNVQIVPFEAQEVAIANTETTMQETVTSDHGRKVTKNELPGLPDEDADSVDENMPIGPYARPSGAETDGTDTEDGGGGGGMYDDYNSPGTNNEEPGASPGQAQGPGQGPEQGPEQGPGQSVEMQQFSMAPFD